MTLTDLVSKTATCKKCGSTTVTWRKSAKSGKWYLTEVFTTGGVERTDYRTFHSQFCGKPEDHKRVQDEINADEAKQDDDRDDAQKAREREAIEREFLLITLCDDNPKAAQVKLDANIRELRSIAENPTSMDYMTDHMRERNHVAALKAENTILAAGLGVLVEQRYLSRD